jgi:adenosine deaminase
MMPQDLHGASPHLRHGSYGRQRNVRDLSQSLAKRRTDDGTGVKMVGADFAAFLNRLPKVDVHCHLVGALRTGTLAALARKHGIALPRPEHQLYDFEDFYAFLDILRLAATVMREPDDFARVTYEALEDGHRSGNLRHAELMFNPQYFYASGISYRGMLDGLIDGIRSAARDFGTTALLIPSIDRQISPGQAMEILDDVLADRRDEVAGIGLDGAERSGPPETFASLYQRAGRAGLMRTAHVCEDNQTLEEAPPRNYAICRDVLGCDRLDHGYNLLADPQMVARARDDGLFFNTCAITSVRKNLLRRQAGIAAMIEAGLNVTLNTDDPRMFKTDIGHSYRTLFEAQGWGPEGAIRLSLAGVDACWLPESQRAFLRQQFEQEIAQAQSEFGKSAPGRHVASERPVGDSGAVG